MPPKGSQKIKTDPDTPVKAKSASVTPAKAKPAAGTPAKAPIKRVAKPSPVKKEPTISKRLSYDDDVAIPIDVMFEGESTQSKVRTSGDYSHNLKLTAPASFTLVKSIVIPDGEYEGFQAILVRPAKAFPFLNLPKEARARIYNFYFASGGVVGGDIAIEGKRKSGKSIFAKTYSNSSQYRVAILTVNKEIHDEATPIFYANNIVLENTSTAIDFMSGIPNATRRLLTNVSINSWVKTTGRSAMCLLAEAANLQRLHLDHNVITNDDPVKAAKNFYEESDRFMEAVAATKGINGPKDAGVDVLSFGKKALTYKDDDDKIQPWTEEMKEEFFDNLRAKLK